MPLEAEQDHVREDKRVAAWALDGLVYGVDDPRLAHLTYWRLYRTEVQALLTRWGLATSEATGSASVDRAITLMMDRLDGRLVARVRAASASTLLDHDIQAEREALLGDLHVLSMAVHRGDSLRGLAGLYQIERDRLLRASSLALLRSMRVALRRGS